VAYESFEEVQTAAKKSVKLDHGFLRGGTSAAELAVPIAIWMQRKSSALCVHSQQVSVLCQALDSQSYLLVAIFKQCHLHGHNTEACSMNGR